MGMPNFLREHLARIALLTQVLALAICLTACAPTRASNIPGSADATTTTAPIATQESPTPDEDACGVWSAASGSTGQPVAAQYGAIDNCERVNGSWVIATEGLTGKPGVIGVDICHSDPICLNGQTDRGIAVWTFYPAPFTGGVRLLGIAAPGVLLIDNAGHQLHFTIATGDYAP